MSDLLKTTAKKAPTVKTAVSEGAAVISPKKQGSARKSEYQKAVRFINILLETAKKAVGETRFAYGDKRRQVDEFNNNIEKDLTAKLSEVRAALEQGLTLKIGYNDSEKKVPHSLKFVDPKGRKQGPAIYNFAPNFNQPVSIGYVEYKDDVIVNQQDWTYNPITEYARAVQDKSVRLAGLKDLENPTPIDIKPSVADKVKRFMFFKRKALNRNVINPLKDAIKGVFQR